jgi:hypothetical protein
MYLQKKPAYRGLFFLELKHKKISLLRTWHLLSELLDQTERL